MRGTVSLFGAPLLWCRFIPAHAGNRVSGGMRRDGSSVHPRACGEQPEALVKSKVSRGSSPRMRGTVKAFDLLNGRIRFIPAHAGNRRLKSSTSPTSPVHPRACGEQRAPDTQTIPLCGSSPRMRGTGSGGDFNATGGRFIPAHAGNRPVLAVSALAIPVHPRACGEQEPDISLLKPPPGSSPRMRGTDDEQEAAPWRCRFIPAHAGNSINHFARATVNAVHPRACGEQNLVD